MNASALSVLVVSREPGQRELLCRWLRPAAYDVAVAEDFHTGRSLLESRRFELLVTDVKLAAYNGLQLAIWNSAKRRATKSILIGELDTVLQKEAERQRAVYLVQPIEERTFLATVSTILATPIPTRRSVRKRVSIDAVVDGLFASVTDVSYEGLCLALPGAEAVTLPAFFMVHVPGQPMSYRVQRVWAGRVRHAPDTLLCGATLPALDTPAAAQWRALVDSIADRSPVAARPSR